MFLERTLNARMSIRHISTHHNALDLLDLLVRRRDGKHVIDIFLLFYFLFLDHLDVNGFLLPAPDALVLILAAIQAGIVIRCRYLLTCAILLLCFCLYFLFVAALGERKQTRRGRRRCTLAFWCWEGAMSFASR